MAEQQWKPGAVAMVTLHLGEGGFVHRRAIRQAGGWQTGSQWVGSSLGEVTSVRPLVVIDPEDREQVERLRDLFDGAYCEQVGLQLATALRGDRGNAMQAALRSLIEPSRVEEPADPTACVADHRDNIWRLLADGDWVCTSGPDIGEYIAWDRLARERGPLSVEVAGGESDG